MISGAKLIRGDTSCNNFKLPASYPCVGVLMSTFNAGKYLEPQVESIAAQLGVRVKMFVRDDGSTDNTRLVLNKLRKKLTGCIVEWNVEYGENCGYVKSFERLLWKAAGCDYFAFSDQDDIWLPEKLSKAIIALTETGAGCYASSVAVVDENLEPLSTNSFKCFVYSLPSEFIRHRLAGHTMVWNTSFHEYMRQTGLLPCWSHDQYVVICALLFGSSLYLDLTSYVLHRRITTSVTPGGSGLLKRLKHEKEIILDTSGSMHRAKLAEAILRLNDVSINEIDRCFLNDCVHRNAIAVIHNANFRCGLVAGDIEARISVLFGRFW